jgi:hypothetical protein
VTNIVVAAVAESTVAAAFADTVNTAMKGCHALPRG